LTENGVGAGVVLGGEGARRRMRPAASAVYRGAASASWAPGRMRALRRVGGLEA